jgi:hypothetical protein
VAKSVFQPTPACIKKLKNALTQFETLNKLEPLTLYKETVETTFNKAFTMLTANRTFAKWDW